MRRKALQCVLSEKIRNGKVVCIESLGELDGRTKSMKRLLENLGITGSVLVVTDTADQNVVRSGSNLKQVWTLPSDLVNANDVLKKETVLATVGAIRRIADLCTAPNYRARKSASIANSEEAQE
jgi:large subunit ribosomal protein L4